MAKNKEELLFKQKTGHIKMTRDLIAFNMISYLLIATITIICVLPFIMILSGSFTAEESIRQDGFRLIPKVFSLESYKILMKSPDTLINAYIVTVSITVIGTTLALFLTSMTAYVLFRKDFPWRNQFAFFFFFTTLFSGGLVPWYILMVRFLGMKDNPAVLVIPYLFSVFNILIMRNFMNSIPDALIESGKIDGAGDFYLYWNIILPLSLPSLATIGLFIALGLWNEWFNTMLFIDSPKLIPLQYFLYRMLNSMQAAAMAAEKAHIALPEMPTQSYRMVMTVVTTGPIIFVYPFVQRFFIKGITIGSVKG